MFLRIIFFVLLLCINKLYAQTLKSEINSLSFMAGKWFQQHQWGDMEENWSAPMGNCMMCSYRCVKDGKVVFYEFIVIEQTDSVPVMKLRHFNPGNIGWEEKDKPHEYPLISLGKNKAQFQRPDKKLLMTFIRQSSDKMQVVLEREDKNGELKKEVFNYTLKKE